MPSAGLDHSVFLLSDGCAVACGQNICGQCDIPELENGRRYVQVDAGVCHTLLLRDDGTVAACGDNAWGQCDPPKHGLDFECWVQVSAGYGCSLLLDSNGRVIYRGYGGPHAGREGITFVHDFGTIGPAVVQIKAGIPFSGFGLAPHSFLFSNGAVLLHTTSTTGTYDEGQLLNFDPIRSFMQVSTAPFVWQHTSVIGLSADGANLSVWGNHQYDQFCIPSLEEGVTYTKFSSSGLHTVLLRSDGQPAACGNNRSWQCTLPELRDGLTYIDVSAGFGHTLLLRSDCAVAAIGDNADRQCEVPIRHDRTGVRFVPSCVPRADMVLFLAVRFQADSLEVVLRHMSGTSVAASVWTHGRKGRFRNPYYSPFGSVRHWVVEVIKPQARKVHVVMPNGDKLETGLSWAGLLAECRPNGLFGASVEYNR